MKIKVGSPSFCYALVTLLATADSFAKPPLPGNINPGYKAECEYLPHLQDCKDYARQFCEQFPAPENCFPVLISPTDQFVPGRVNTHAMVLTRSCYPIHASPGVGERCRYCLVEPQEDGTSVIGECWDDSKNFPLYSPEQIRKNPKKLLTSPPVVTPPAPTGEAVCELLKNIGLPCQGSSPALIIPFDRSLWDLLCEADDQLAIDHCIDPRDIYFGTTPRQMESMPFEE